MATISIGQEEPEKAEIKARKKVQHTSFAARKMVASIGFQSIAFVFNSMMTFRLFKENESKISVTYLEVCAQEANLTAKSTVNQLFFIVMNTIM